VVRGMDNDDTLIDPAFRVRISQIAAARQMQVSQMTAAALTSLPNIAASLWRTSEAMAWFPEVAENISKIEITLTVAIAILKRWLDGEVPSSVEIETFVRVYRWPIPA
jgi:hypothetical protein